MTFASVETSEFGAQKIKLFDISFGAHHWYYTDHTETVNFNATLWLAQEGIAHDEIPDALNLDNGKLNVLLPQDHDIADLLKLGSPGGVLRVTIWHGHVGGEFVRKWQGRIIERATEYPYCKLVTESVLASARRQAAGLVVSVSCPHDLYGADCKVSKAAFQVPAVVTAKAGLMLTLSGLGTVPPNWLVMGFAEWAHPTLSGITMTGSLLAHDGLTVTLAMPAPTIAVGTALVLYPNCNKERDGDCLNKFNNTLNHGGIPVNGRNPFSTFRLY